MLNNLRLARKNLRAHRLRTALTITGVAVGVFIITLVLVVSSGLDKSIRSQISALKNNLLIVRDQGGENTGMAAFSPLAITPISTLSERDFVDVAKTPGVESAAPMMFLSEHFVGTVNELKNVRVVATTENFAEIFALGFSDGGWIDKNPPAPEVVLGAKLAQSITGDTSGVVGQIVAIHGKNFTVAGVVKQRNEPLSLAGTDIDTSAFVAKSSGADLANGNFQIGQIVAKTDRTKIPEIERSIAQKLDKNATIQTGDRASNLLAGALGTITNVALIFAIIALFIGGVGVMNIMIVGVIERTHEIGIRKAVGATAGQILAQFLTESLLITFCGGIFGVTLAYLTAFVIDLEFSLPLAFDWWIFAIGLGMPLILGLVFGAGPAFRAARQDPIVALKNTN